MANFKNRKVWGIEFPLISDSNSNPYINYGEGRYGYVSWKIFVQNLHTIKIPFTGPRGGEQWKNIKDAVKSGNVGMLNTGLTGASFLKLFFENSLRDIQETVINFEKGSYLIECNEFIKLKNGSMTYKSIRHFRGYEIKFNTNGVTGFSIWKGKTCLEDRLWSIDKTECAIEQMKGGK